MPKGRATQNKNVRNPGQEKTTIIKIKIIQRIKPNIVFGVLGLTIEI